MLFSNRKTPSHVHLQRKHSLISHQTQKTPWPHLPTEQAQERIELHANKNDCRELPVSIVALRDEKKVSNCHLIANTVLSCCWLQHLLYGCTHTHTMHMHTCTYIHTHRYTHICTNTNTHTHISHTQAHIRIHTHTHINMTQWKAVNWRQNRNGEPIMRHTVNWRQDKEC